MTGEQVGERGFVSTFRGERRAGERFIVVIGSAQEDWIGSGV